MQTRRAKGKAPETDNIFENPEVCATARDFKDNWEEKYRDNRQLQNDHLEKHRLKVPLKTREVEADFVAMKIWKLDGRGRVVEIERTKKGEALARKEDLKRGSPQELKRDSPHRQPSSEAGPSQKHSETTSKWKISQKGGTKFMLKRKQSAESRLAKLCIAPPLTAALLRQDPKEINQGTFTEKVSLLTLPADLWLMIQDFCTNTTDECKTLRRLRDSYRTFRDKIIVKVDFREHAESR